MNTADACAAFVESAEHKVNNGEPITRDEYQYLCAIYRFINDAFLEKAKRLVK